MGKGMILELTEAEKELLLGGIDFSSKMKENEPRNQISGEGSPLSLLAGKRKQR